MLFHALRVGKCFIYTLFSVETLVYVNKELSRAGGRIWLRPGPMSPSTSSRCVGGLALAPAACSAVASASSVPPGPGRRSLPGGCREGGSRWAPASPADPHAAPRARRSPCFTNPAFWRGTRPPSALCGPNPRERIRISRLARACSYLRLESSRIRPHMTSVASSLWVGGCSPSGSSPLTVTGKREKQDVSTHRIGTFFIKIRGLSLVGRSVTAPPLQDGGSASEQAIHLPGPRLVQAVPLGEWWHLFGVALSCCGTQLMPGHHTVAPVGGRERLRGEVCATIKL